MKPDLLERVREMRKYRREVYGVESDDVDALLCACRAALETLAAERETLVAHISEQATFAETRIKDGVELGASAWRLALEDIARENRQALASIGGRG